MAPWNGSAPNQTFGRTDGTRTGNTTWTQAEGAGVDILSSDHDTHDSDVAAGINASLKKDGGNTATANLPMGGFKHTGAGDATGRTQYLTGGQASDDEATYYATVGGTADAITLTSNGFLDAQYNVGQRVRFIAASDNTTAVTLAIGAIAADAVVLNDGAATALSAGDIQADSMVEVQFDGTNWLLMSASRVSTNQIIDSAVTTAKIAAAAVTNVKLAYDAAASSMSGADTLDATDVGSLILLTGTSYTVTLPAASGVSTGFWVRFRNDASGIITLARNGSDTINGAAADYSIYPGESLTLLRNGAGWQVLVTRPTYTLTAATLSGTSTDITGIPSWAKRIIIQVRAMSWDAAAFPLLQIGSGSITTTGYSGQAWDSSGDGVVTSGIPISRSIAAAESLTGLITLSKGPGTNVWTCTAVLARVGTTGAGMQAAGVTPDPGTIDRVRITTTAGTANADGGTVVVACHD